MYTLEILVNEESDYNAKFEFNNYADCSRFLAIVISQGYEVKVSQSWGSDNA